jgi:hypothetical protein
VCCNKRCCLVCPAPSKRADLLTLPALLQNLAARLVMRTRLRPFMISIASAAGAWFVHPASYNSYVQVWLGLGPMHVSFEADTVI